MNDEETDPKVKAFEERRAAEMAAADALDHQKFQIPFKTIAECNAAREQKRAAVRKIVDELSPIERGFYDRIQLMLEKLCDAGADLDGMWPDADLVVVEFAKELAKEAR